MQISRVMVETRKSLKTFLVRSIAMEERIDQQRRRLSNVEKRENESTSSRHSIPGEPLQRLAKRVNATMATMATDITAMRRAIDM